MEAKDTTGCGDNFVAGFIHSVLRGKALWCARFCLCNRRPSIPLEIGGHMAVRSLGRWRNSLEAQTGEDLTLTGGKYEQSNGS